MNSHAFEVLLFTASATDVIEYHRCTEKIRTRNSGLQVQCIAPNSEIIKRGLLAEWLV